MPVKLFSPAKVNLCLHVLGKRKDGYHELETVFERISLGDDIVLSLLPSKIVLTCDGPGIETQNFASLQGPSNIAYHAADLLKRRFHVKQGVRIRIKKRIPVGAGLGGGSSNAAAALLGLNRFWKLGLSRKTLLKLGTELGSDVPFFLLETPFAVGKGRGEKLRPALIPSRKLWHLVVRPPFAISTKEAYGELSKSRNGARLTLPRGDVRMLLHSIRKGDLRSLSKYLSNSLEVALNKRLTTISKIKESLLAEGAFGALLSGSGSCVFGLFPSERNARRAARRLSRSNRAWKVFVASTY